MTADRDALREGLLKELTFAGNDPGHAGQTNSAPPNYKGDRSMGRWIADAVMVGPIFSAILAQADSAERMEAERDAYAAVLTYCVTALKAVPLGLLPGCVDMMVVAALDAPMDGDRTRAEIIAAAEGVRARDRSATQAEADRLSAEVEALRKALEPFAAAGEVNDWDTLGMHRPDSDTVWFPTTSFSGRGADVTIGHFRAARAALDRAADQPEPARRADAAAQEGL